MSVHFLRILFVLLSYVPFLQGGSLVSPDNLIFPGVRLYVNIALTHAAVWLAILVSLPLQSPTVWLYYLACLGQTLLYLDLHRDTFKC
jgi:hypothetical protein